MKNKFLIILTSIIMIFSFCSCSNKQANFDKNSDIAMVSREDGSGTKTTFSEKFDLIKKENGTKTDLTTKEADVVNKTDVVINHIKSDIYSIGYISVGSLNNQIKAVKIDNVYPTKENIQQKKYKAARNFNLVIKKGKQLDKNSEDFFKFILSKQGKNVVEKTGFFSIQQNPKNYTSSNLKGKIVVIGSSSVSPVIEKLKEAYEILNPNMKIELQQNDSTTGIKSLQSGICDIAMSSRQLNEDELSTLKPVPIAIDAIAIIVNQKNPVTNLDSTMISKIYKGQQVKWDFLE